MLKTFTQIRVRYAETDQMGVVYYGNYAIYLEVARTEWVRNLGLTYRELEDNYVTILPVVSLQIDYKKSATYDDLLTIETTIAELPSVKLIFDHKIYRESTLLATAKVVLVFVNKESKRPCKAPDIFIRKLAAILENSNEPK
ncbi:MAG: acyl-CoA thioesterase [Bacteroidia bacterium]|nr:acyl-CoA thioesterase [Bacteroidia bacterium]